MSLYQAGDTDQFAEIGKAYGRKLGFYLLVGPNWKGELAAGVNAVVRSFTELAAWLAPQSGIAKLGLAFKYYREFGAEDRLEGDLFILTFGLPLDMIFMSIGVM